MDEEKWWQKRWGFSAGMLILSAYLGFQGWKTIAKLDDSSVEYVANSTTILVNVALLYGVVFGGRQFVEWLIQTLVKVLREARLLVPVPRASSRAASAAHAATATTAAVAVKPQAAPASAATAPSNVPPASEAPPPPSPATRKRSVWPVALALGTLALVALVAVVFWPRTRPAATPPVPSPPQATVTLTPPAAPHRAMPSYCNAAGDAFTCRLETGKALWDIANDCYGDPLRANELWEANRAKFPRRTVREIPQGAEITMTGECAASIE